MGTPDHNKTGILDNDLRERCLVCDNKRLVTWENAGVALTSLPVA